jgi:hypothetical protein
LNIATNLEREKGDAGEGGRRRGTVLLLCFTNVA